MDEAFDVLSPEDKNLLVEAAQPSSVRPMLATLTHEPFSHPDWVYERKLDGERCLASRRGSDVRLTSRNSKSIAGSYPELVDALKRQDREHFVTYGEVVAFCGNLTSFSRLQERMHVTDPDRALRTKVEVLYHIDLLYLDDTTQLPLLCRKQMLKRALRGRGRGVLPPRL